MVDQFPRMTSRQTKELLDKYPEDVGPAVDIRGDWFPALSLAYGEAVFICPTNNILNAMVSANASIPAYSYRFNVKDKELVAEGKGVPHVFETEAVFGTGMLNRPARQSYATYNAKAVTIVQHYIVSFARTLDPNVHKAADAPKWEVWDDGGERMVLQTEDSTMETVSEQERSRCRFWRSIRTTTSQRR